MPENSSLFTLSIDPVSKLHLSDAAKWARILAVAGIVSLIIVVANGIYTTNNAFAFTEADETGELDAGYKFGVIVGVLLITLIPLFALIILLRFSTALKTALAADNQTQLNSSFQQLKVYFRYLGILTLIFVGLMALSFVLKLGGRIT